MNVSLVQKGDWFIMNAEKTASVILIISRNNLSPRLCWTLRRRCCSRQRKNSIVLMDMS